MTNRNAHLSGLILFSRHDIRGKNRFCLHVRAIADAALGLLRKKIANVQDDDKSFLNISAWDGRTLASRVEGEIVSFVNVNGNEASIDVP